MDKDKYNYNLRNNNTRFAKSGHVATEKYKFLCYKSELKIDQFGRFIKNSSKNI